jgi:hypothetical protein
LGSLRSALTRTGRWEGRPVSEVPAAWLAHFSELQKVISATVQLPFDPREPVQRLPANIRVEFDRSPDIRFEINVPEKVMRLPIGAYLRCRMIALSLVKNRDRRRIPAYFKGATLGEQEVRRIIDAMRSPFPSLEALLSEVERHLAAIGNDEPEAATTVFGSESESVAYYALDFLATHEACHFWYGHLGVWRAAQPMRRKYAWSFKEVQADMGAGTSLANHVAFDLEHYAIPEGSPRAFARVCQLSQLAGLAIAMTFDLIDVLNPNPGENAGYESYGVRSSISHLGFGSHLVAKCGVEAGEWGRLGLSGAEVSYSLAVGRPNDDLETRAARLVDILAADEARAFLEEQYKYIPNTPDLEGYKRHCQAEAEAGSQRDPEVSQRVSLLFSEGVVTDAPSAGVVGLSVICPGLNDKVPSAPADHDPAVPVDTFWRSWVDPIGAVRRGLADAVVNELQVAVDLASDEIRKPLFLWPDRSTALDSWVCPQDAIFKRFRISIGTGLTARLPLILRCLFDRPGSGAPCHDFRCSPSDPLDESYAALTGTLRESNDALRWWKAQTSPTDSGESYELRQGWRYGLLFLILRAAARVHRGHFPGLERAERKLREPAIAVLRSALQLDADLWALVNLVVYIGHFVDFETGREESAKPLRRILVRAKHLRAAFFGILVILSCLPATARMSSVNRFALAVRGLDDLGVPTNGKPLFLCFEWMKNRPPFSDAFRKWNWCEFASACFDDWDGATGSLLREMRDRHGLPATRNPFISADALRIDEAGSGMLEFAAAQATQYVTDANRILIPKGAFSAAYGTD